MFMLAMRTIGAARAIAAGVAIDAVLFIIVMFMLAVRAIGTTRAVTAGTTKLTLARHIQSPA